jgi:adenylate cyclase
LGSGRSQAGVEYSNALSGSEQAMVIRLPSGEAVGVDVSLGESIAEAARRVGSQVQGLCRGHGRCGMCAVAVVEGADGVGAAGEAEARALRILGAGPDLRLACQARRA